MKKVLLFFAFACCMSAPVNADPIELSFSLEIIGQGGTYNPLPKSPVRPPQVALDDYTLTLDFGGSYYFWSEITL